MGEFAGPGLKVAGSIASFFGNINAGNAAAAQGEAAGHYYENMATVAKQRAAINAARVRKEGVAVGSRIVQTIGAAGVDAHDGSALDQLGAWAAEYEFRALTTEWQGDTEAASQLYQAGVARYQGKAAANAAYSRAIAALSGGAGTIADMDFGGGGGGGVPAPSNINQLASGAGLPGLT